jgi:hypothetical protein
VEARQARGANFGGPQKNFSPPLVPVDLPPGTNRALFHFLCTIFILIYFFINGLAVVNCIKINLWVQENAKKYFILFRFDIHKTNLQFIFMCFDPLNT